MRYLLKLVLALLPGYLFVMTSGFELGDSCSSEDARNKIGDVEGLSESTGICTEVESEAQKKFFGLIWLPVYKWGVNVAQLHYAFFFFTWVVGFGYTLFYG